MAAFWPCEPAVLHFNPFPGCRQPSCLLITMELSSLAGTRDAALIRTASSVAEPWRKQHGGPLPVVAMEVALGKYQVPDLNLYSLEQL
jgi:hypothetical protein